MISTAHLSENVVDSWVAFDKHGQVLQVDVPSDVGPAALLVAPVTDALKMVDGNDRLVESVDRSAVWHVEAILLNEIAIRRLDRSEYTAGELIDAIRESGLAWHVSPISDP